MSTHRNTHIQHVQGGHADPSSALSHTLTQVNNKRASADNANRHSAPVILARQTSTYPRQGRTALSLRLQTGGTTPAAAGSETLTFRRALHPPGLFLHAFPPFTLPLSHTHTPLSPLHLCSLCQAVPTCLPLCVYVPPPSPESGSSGLGRHATGSCVSQLATSRALPGTEAGSRSSPPGARVVVLRHGSAEPPLWLSCLLKGETTVSQTHKDNFQCAQCQGVRCEADSSKGDRMDQTFCGFALNCKIGGL